MHGDQEDAKKRVKSQTIKLSGEKAVQLADILGLVLPRSGEISVLLSGQGLEYGDYMEDMASVLKQRELLRIFIVAACW